MVGFELGLKMVAPPTIPTSSDDVCLGFALYITSEAKLEALCGISGFKPTSSPYTALSAEQKTKFMGESQEYKSIRAGLQRQLRKFWSNYEHGGGHMKRLEEVVSELPRL